MCDSKHELIPQEELREIRCVSHQTAETVSIKPKLTQGKIHPEPKFKYNQSREVGNRVFSQRITKLK